MPEKALLIAVVDDEESFRRALQRLMRSVGHNVETFASGEEFLKSLQDQTPDCAIVDLHMPGLNGFEIQAQLAARGSRIPIVIVTGHDTPEARAQAMERGAKGYLRKPFDDTALVVAIRNALRNDREAHA